MCDDRLASVRIDPDDGRTGIGGHIDSSFEIQPQTEKGMSVLDLHGPGRKA